MSNKYNETKYLILNTIFISDSYLTPAEISKITGISLDAAKASLKNYSKWRYIWRKKEYRKTKSNKFCYHYLKPKGFGILMQLKKRVEMRTKTGLFVSLNLRKSVTEEARKKYIEAIK